MTADREIIIYAGLNRNRMVKMEILWTHCYECKFVMRLLSIDHCGVKLYL